MSVLRASRADGVSGPLVNPLAIDLFCGLGGWTEGLLAEGYDVIGFDIERHQYGEHRYPAQLVVQDVTTLNGAQFKDATLIVASPPCQEYSYMAMPWKRAKAKAAAIRADASGAVLEKLNRLWSACWRIKLEASAAAGHSVPMVIENVKGAQPWVGRARWSFGSFYLWGDVPALMPITAHRKQPGVNWHRYGQTGGAEKSTLDWTMQATKNTGGSWFAVAHNTTSGKGQNPDGRMDGIKQRGSGREWFAGEGKISRMTSSKSPARKAASAMIAKIPLPLSRHIAATYNQERGA